MKRHVKIKPELYKTGIYTKQSNSLVSNWRVAEDTPQDVVTYELQKKTTSSGQKSLKSAT
jgi:hypothetical protein